MAFVIALGALVTYFVTNFIKEARPAESQQEKIYCQDTQISMENVCRSHDNVSIRFTLKNKGSYAITRFTINREHSGSTLTSCYILSDRFPPPGLGEPEGILPGREFNFSLGLKPELSENIQEVEIAINCPDRAYTLASFVDPAINDTYKIIELSAIPWVTIESKPVACPDKKTTITQNLLNMYCNLTS